jgi:hypothetical protein
MPAFRPTHASAALQVPLLPVPQQAWPLAPQVPQTLSPVAITQVSGVMHAVMAAASA